MSRIIPSFDGFFVIWDHVSLPKKELEKLLNDAIVALCGRRQIQDEDHFP